MCVCEKYISALGIEFPTNDSYYQAEIGVSVPPLHHLC